MNYIFQTYFMFSGIFFFENNDWFTTFYLPIVLRCLQRKQKLGFFFFLQFIVQAETLRNTHSQGKRLGQAEKFKGRKIRMIALFISVVHELSSMWPNEIRVAFDKFPDFFRMGTFIDSTLMKLYSHLK